jgi:DNA-binding transcriptional regulator YdaS (Cro superfamily)
MNMAEATVEMSSKKPSPIERAVQMAGSQRALAKILGVSSQAVSKWVLENKVPAERVLAIEAATRVSRHLLRPDIYPPESVVA